MADLERMEGGLLTYWSVSVLSSLAFFESAPFSKCYYILIRSPCLASPHL